MHVCECGSDSACVCIFPKTEGSGRSLRILGWAFLSENIPGGDGYGLQRNGVGKEYVQRPRLDASWGPGGGAGGTTVTRKGKILNALRSLESPLLICSPIHLSEAVSDRGRTPPLEAEEAGWGAGAHCSVGSPPCTPTLSSSVPVPYLLPVPGIW